MGCPLTAALFKSRRTPPNPAPLLGVTRKNVLAPGRGRWPAPQRVAVRLRQGLAARPRRQGRPRCSRGRPHLPARLGERRSRPVGHGASCRCSPTELRGAGPGPAQSRRALRGAPALGGGTRGPLVTPPLGPLRALGPASSPVGEGGRGAEGRKEGVEAAQGETNKAGDRLLRG